MPSQPISTVENNFNKGLVTEYTGLNFPENAATDTDNCTYTLVGDVVRRQGIDFEQNYNDWSINRFERAVSTYKWNNAGGDGATQLLVTQTGEVIYFWLLTASTTTNPLSNHLLGSTVNLNSFVAAGGTLDITTEVNYADGNGYLFIFHPNCDPIYCAYNAGTIVANKIDIQTRDFVGLPENVPVNFRPLSLTAEHNYNLANQGWTSGNSWSATSPTAVNVVSGGAVAFQVLAGIAGTNLGDIVNIFYVGPAVPGTSPPNGVSVMGGTLTAYAGTTMTITVNSGIDLGALGSSWLIVPQSAGSITKWKTDEGNYPSNADVWWYFKNASGVFAPATTQPNVTLSLGQAPQGHYILNAFNQTRSALSGIGGLTDITTTRRPSNGAWFQGRIWYAGTAANQQATGDAPFYSWTENIYFSQVNVGTSSNFGTCYQTNDPTSETLFDLLPTDGGVLQIQGSGLVYKLFPMSNGMLVFAANGVYFITGSTGIGFTANDYTIVHISSVQSVSSTSFVDVQGLPYFWNEEGIYSVQPNASDNSAATTGRRGAGGLSVIPMSVGTIQSFYDAIPRHSKQYVRGAYHPIDYTIQWIYKSKDSVNVSDRYSFDRILNYNTRNQSFFPYTVDMTQAAITGINYVAVPGAGDVPDPSFKYFASFSAGPMSFADEHSTAYKDWENAINGGVDYSSYFVTGYKIHGQGQRRFQLPYIYTFSRNEENTAFYLQALWDYSNSRNSGRWSTKQYVVNDNLDYNKIFKRHRLRGHGLILQLKVSSVTGKPFDIEGWSTYEVQNAGP